jgi:hypothetical protein
MLLQTHRIGSLHEPLLLAELQKLSALPVGLLAQEGRVVVVELAVGVHRLYVCHHRRHSLVVSLVDTLPVNRPSHTQFRTGLLVFAHCKRSCNCT